ncbi:MAG: hypothetical protein JNJ54_17375 [Myxococcaceae bacterium]|nr:hypothetical protein [Myxococcaceae bacterium]
MTAFASLDLFGGNPVVLTLRDLGDGGATAVETWTQGLGRGAAFVHQEDAGFRATHVASNRQGLTVVGGTTAQNTRIDFINPMNLVGTVTVVPVSALRRLAQVKVLTNPPLALALIDTLPYTTTLVRLASPFPAAPLSSVMTGSSEGDDFAEIPGAQRLSLVGRCAATCSFGAAFDNSPVAGPTARLATASTMVMSGATWPDTPTLTSFTAVNDVRFANAPLRVAADGQDLVVIAGTDRGLGLRIERHDLSDGGITSWTSTTAVRVVDAIRSVEGAVLLLAHFDAPTSIGGVTVPWAMQSGRNVLLIRVDRTSPLSVTPFSDPGDQTPVAFAELLSNTNRAAGLMIVGNEGPDGFLWRVP